MSSDRFDLVKESFEKKAIPSEKVEGKPSDYFGELVFDRRKMRKYLDADTLSALLECIDKGHPLDRKTADGVAEGMKEWASWYCFNKFDNLDGYKADINKYTEWEKVLSEINEKLGK